MGTESYGLEFRPAVLSFSRRRGRPRSVHRGTDTGTPELIMKRLKGETAETLDLCLARNIITREQHWCGIHLRWLYTLRYGAPGVRAVDPSHFGGREIKTDDPEWRSSREKEYHDAMRILAAGSNVALALSICIHNERPNFLYAQTARQIAAAEKGILSLRNALDALAAHWGRK
ncbi:MAG: hypothetical protein KGJ06_01865 [Pseudomonadota bacterium]|nr:hypothetical protein [Pseudomonadota bacterium]